VDKLADIKLKIKGRYPDFLMLFVVPTNIIKNFNQIEIKNDLKDSFSNVVQCVTTDDNPASGEALCKICQWKVSNAGKSEGSSACGAPNKKRKSSK